MSATTPAPLGRPEIGLTGATYLELGLEALRDGDQVRAIGALASIDETAWSAILDRFPYLLDLAAEWGRTR